MESTLSHVALLVPSVENAAAHLTSLGIVCGEPESFPGEGTKEVYVGSYETESGLLLLLEAIADGPYQRALSKRGPGLHHIAIDVKDLEAAITEAQAAGWQLHPVSEHTRQHNTAWLFLKGIPTLIEVNHGPISTRPLKITSLELPISRPQHSLFAALGIGEVIKPCDSAPQIVIDGHLTPWQSLVLG